jgi:hypothetical protein
MQASPVPGTAPANPRFFHNAESKVTRQCMQTGQAVWAPGGQSASAEGVPCA